MKYSFLIGRWQPFHDGHKSFIQAVLDEGKNVCIGVKDTPRDKDNPYSYMERKLMIKKAFPDAIVIKVPNIDEVCYGRDVGWSMRRVHHSKEHIRATDIRRGNE